jgi:hypothetical protein
LIWNKQSGDRSKFMTDLLGTRPARVSIRRDGARREPASVPRLVAEASSLSVALAVSKAKMI